MALPNFSTEEACRRLRDEVLPTWRDSVGSLELADAWKSKTFDGFGSSGVETSIFAFSVSPSLATILLTEATNLGVVAADVSIEGDRWQRNMFTEYHEH